METSLKKLFYITKDNFIEGMTLASILLLISIVLIVSSMLSDQQAKQCVTDAMKSLPPQIQYIPTSIYQEQLMTPDLSITYNNIFNNSDLWERYPFAPTYYSPSYAR